MEESRPSRDEVIAWMASTGRGMKAAAAHFDLPLGTVKRWRHELRAKHGALPAARTTTRGKVVKLAPPERPAPPSIEEDELVAFERKLVELEADMAVCAPGKKAALYTRWHEYRDRVDELRRARKVARALTEEELVERLEQEFRRAPLRHLVLAVRIYGERVGMRLLPDPPDAPLVV